MEPIKFWAETEQDTENFFNYLRAMSIPDDLKWVDKNSILKDKSSVGWYVSEQGYVTFSDDRDWFDDKRHKEFFFPIPGDEFVEVSPNSVSELDGQKLDKESLKHSHYFKDVKHLDYIDVYRTLSLFNVTDPCLQHTAKKILVAGGRGAGKDIAQDIDEAIDSLLRWKEMKNEDKQ